jgi:DNA sulfur modification protein DndB
MSPQPLYLPALRCYMGDWTYYVTTMPLSELASRVQRSREIYQVQGLEDLIQRELTNRVGDIVEYLLIQPERFFNAVIIGVHEGEPEWFAIDIKASPVIGEPHIDSSLLDVPGIIKLTGDEKMFAIDGQHRIEAIKQAINRDANLGSEHLAVIFIAHRTTTEGRQRTRRLWPKAWLYC